MLVIAAVLAVSSLINMATRDYVFKISTQHSKILRTDYQSKTLDTISLIITELADKYFVTIAISIVCNTLSTHKTFILVLVASTSTGLVNLLKSVFQEPRPFFLEDIKPFLCRLEHGDPSGHSVMVVAVYATLS